MPKSWEDLRSEMAGLQICWTDEFGIHVTAPAALATDAPATCTHVWGWGDSRLIRARIDNGRIILAVLHFADTPGADPVICRVEDDLAWRSREGESAMMRLASDTDPDIINAAATAFTVIDGPRLSFLKI